MFSINYRDPRPIYEQVKDRLRLAIITGSISADEKIPSVRELAGQLAINPNTIQRAYRELETDGFIYSVPGKGSFVGDCHAALEARRVELFNQLDATATEILHLGVTADALCAHLKELVKREDRI